MNFTTASYTNCGGRANNEDCYFYDNGVWMVADGLGGHDSGEVASKTAAESIADYVKNNGVSVSSEYIANAIKTANLAVINKQKEADNYASMRTTIVLAATDGTTLRFGNVGDTRFYYFKKGVIFAQSEDHSVAAATVKLGESTYEQIREDPDRNKLIKVLGDKEELSVKLPETCIFPESGDALLMCSDGFWEYVYETEMEIDLCKSVSPGQWLDFMIKRIILRTKNTDNDNFTAIAVMIQ